MPNTLIKIKTPVWTGDIDQKSELLQPSGIVGSLRWWTELILRSIDKYACDPTGDRRCPKEDRNKKYYCSACLIFGATGIRRAFRLNTSGGIRTFSGSALNIKPSGRNRGWYLGSGVVGEIDLKITPLDKDFDENLVLLPLVIASNWGGIGAKTQHGYGVVKVENYPEIRFEQFKNAIEKLTNEDRLSKFGINLRQQDNDGLPKLKEMFFAKVHFEAEDEWWKRVDGIAPRKQGNYKGYVNDPRMKKWVESGSVPIAPAIKNWLRYGKEITTKRGKRIQVSPFKEVSNIEISKWLFGISEGNVKTASRINISCAYAIDDNLWEFRIWGWVPKDGLPVEFNRDGFLDDLKQALDGSGSITVPWNVLLGNQTKNHKLKVLREYNSSRDTMKPNESNISDYIQSLLDGGW
jgi:CRISPR-associated protein Cmr1